MGINKSRFIHTHTVLLDNYFHTSMYTLSASMVIYPVQVSAFKLCSKNKMLCAQCAYKCERSGGSLVRDSLGP